MAVNRQNCCGVPPGANDVYPGSNRGRPEHFSSLFLGLVLAIGWPPQYKVDGRPRPRRFDTNHGSVNYGSGSCPVGFLP